MTDVTLDIKRWGNNLGVRLPAAIVREAQLHTDQRVRITVVNNQVIITPLEDNDLSLEQRIEMYQPEKHGGETMYTEESLGAEKW